MQGHHPGFHLSELVVSILPPDPPTLVGCSIWS
jgi:hypothetical protein